MFVYGVSLPPSFPPFLPSCLPTCLTACLPTHLPVCPSIFLSVFLSTNLSICLSIDRSIDLSIYRSIDLSIYLSIYLSTYLSTAFEIQVLRMSTTKCSNDSRIFQFASAISRQKKKTAKDSAETFVYYVSNSYDIPRYFPKGYRLIFKKSAYLFYLNYIVYF